MPGRRFSPTQNDAPGAMGTGPIAVGADLSAVTTAKVALVKSEAAAPKTQAIAPKTAKKDQGRSPIEAANPEAPPASSGKAPAKASTAVDLALISAANAKKDAPQDKAAAKASRLATLLAEDSFMASPTSPAKSVAPEEKKERPEKIRPEKIRDEKSPLEKSASKTSPVRRQAEAGKAVARNASKFSAPSRGEPSVHAWDRKFAFFLLVVFVGINLGLMTLLHARRSEQVPLGSVSAEAAAIPKVSQMASLSVSDLAALSPSAGLSAPHAAAGSEAAASPSVPQVAPAPPVMKMTSFVPHMPVTRISGAVPSAAPTSVASGDADLLAVLGRN